MKPVAPFSLAFAVLLATSAAAQTTYVRPAYQFPAPAPITGPASAQIGETPVFITPYFGTAVGHDDNLLFSNQNPRSSNLYVVSPGFKLDARDPNKVVQASYQGQVGRYTSSPEDDYVDQTARGQFDMAFDRRNFLRLGYDYIRSHDPRGSTDRPLGSGPDRYVLSAPGATYAFGTPGAPGRIELYYNDAHKRYLTNRQSTIASDRDTQEYGGVFYWRVMPRTYVMAEARETNIRYYLATSPFSADERRYYAGLTWEATAATTGTVKVGQLRREFRHGTFPDFSGTSWEGSVTWAPFSYSKFDVYTARQTNESTGLGDFILSSLAGMTWSHGWTSYVTTAIDARYQRDAYQGFDRTDKTAAVNAKVAYRFRRWLILGAEYTHTKRDSNVPFFEYDRNIYLLTATASM